MFKKGVIITTLIVILVVINYQIVKNEMLLKSGRDVILKLAPLDPRSIMQGDFMRLNFDVARKLYDRIKDSTEYKKSKSFKGIAILKINRKGIGEFKRLNNGEDLSPDEVAVEFEIRLRRVSFGSNSFFFEEGSAKKYQKAKYALLKVANQKAIIMDLLDKDLKKIK